jgi:outer membrane protein OmpA-like peptidoglycan-associated protein
MRVFPENKYQEKEWLAMKADAHKALRQYGEAISTWQQYREWPALGLSYQKLVDERIAQLRFTKEAVDNPVPYNPVNVGEQINTQYFELYPYISPEGSKMYFTRKEKQEDIFEAEWIDENWANVRPLTFNTTENEGAHTVSADGRFLFFTACNRQDGLGSCDIFYSMKTDKGWTNPAGIGAPVNSTDWESQPCFTANNMAMLFSSNRPNGYGGKDLYIAYLDKSFRWKEPINLGPEINTKGDEETPFLHADGRTLYFSSNGHPSVGGKDLYVSRLGADGKWSKPVNLGYPINTEGDETGLFVALNGKSAYLASDRAGGVGNLDIYSFELNKPMQATPSTYVKARIKNKQNSQPLIAEYRIALLQNNDLFAEGISSPTGEFLICIPADTTYALTIDKQGFLFYSDQFQPKGGTLLEPYLLDVFLEPIQQGSSTVLKNVLFAYNSHSLLPASYPELDKLADLLLSNPNIIAEVSGHTDNIGSDSYNLDLSKKRAESVVVYLSVKGVPKARLSAKGYGSAKPIADNATEEGRALNRRTEFRIISQ